MGTLSILFLEDQQTCAIKTQNDLAQAKADANLSFAVTHVETLQAALDALSHQEFDAILSDLSVPDSQGTKTVAALRQQHATCPIVAFTAEDSTSHMLSCLRAGADDYLVKGQSPSSLVVRALLNAIERRKTRSRLRSVQAKAEAIVNAVVDAIITFDADGVIRSVNPGVQRTFGLRPDQVMGQNLLMLASPAQREAFSKRLQELVTASAQTPEPIQWASEAKHSSGARFPVNCVFREISDGAAVHTYCAVIRDTSDEQARMLEVREACERAEAATQAKSEFLANMSHELRTPLTAILGFAETLLVDHSSDDPNFVEAIRTILRNGEHLTGLINDVLDLAKIEAGRFSIVAEPCSPYQITHDVIELLEVRAQNKNLPISASWPTEIPNKISLDETRLRQVLINLTGNAIKFTSKGSVKVSLRYEQVENELIWEIRDTGIGMSPEACETIFEPFVQADKKTSHQFGGTGLGLAITKRLVGMMGGDICVASEQGVGSTFFVRLPLSETPSQFIRPTERTAAANQPKSRPAAEVTPTQDVSLQDTRLLLAEDGFDNQRLISFILKKYGASVDIVENGEIALEQAKAQAAQGTPYDVILMDMQMPVMDGYTATRQLRDAGYAGPIIALTAHAMKGDREECLAAGCDEYATKPIDRDILVRTVVRYANQETSALTT